MLVLYLRFGVSPATLGGIFFGANVFAGISALLASKLAARIGLVRTMVFTHLPSNVLLMLVPLMPTLQLRSSSCESDSASRKWTCLPGSRIRWRLSLPTKGSAAAGITGVARTTGAAVGPVFAGLLFSEPALINWPFYIAGRLKIAYDLLLYRALVRHQTVPED